MREKTFVNFKVLCLFTKVFSKKLGAWYPLATPASNPRKFSLLNSRKFFCESFLLRNKMLQTHRDLFPAPGSPRLHNFNVCVPDCGSLATRQVTNNFSLTVSNERVDLSDSDYVCKHVTEPLWVDKVEITQQGVVIVKECAVVMEKSHSLF